MTASLREHISVLRVLLIEESEDDTRRMLNALRNGGHAVYSQRLETALEIETALRAERWDVVLLSCGLPHLPPSAGVELIRRISPDVPLVLTIDRRGSDIPDEFLGSGANDFVLKSNPVRLLAIVEWEGAKRKALQFANDALIGTDTLDAAEAGEARFFQLASNTPECYWLIDVKNQRITYVSNGYEQIWGRHVEALYADCSDWLKYVHPGDKARVEQAMRRHRMGGLDIRFRVMRPAESMRWLHVRNFPVRDEEGAVVSVGGVASDISSLLGSKHKAAYFAHFDILTALPNQLMFYSHARQMLLDAERRKQPFGVMVIDVDRFREINQTLGHAAGDELLRQIAGRVSGSLCATDILGRLGGDVFAVLLPDLADVRHTRAIASRIAETLISPLRADGQDVFATVGIGVALYPQDGKSPHELVSNARVALRQAKCEGRNSCVFYSMEMHSDIRDRLFLEIDLRNAILRNEFTLYYQPKANCADGRIIGAEALIRWRHPLRGLVPPDQFIPMLEDTGLIVQVGRWVLETACRQAKAWQEAGYELPSVSVNLSIRQLQSETLVRDVAGILAETGLNPACLDLEITESMLMQNAGMAVAMLGALKELGLTISLDDFGTGYSSLAYLKRFPLDAVKVDRSFVQDITADSDDASITRAVITMAHNLKLKVVAEGVETPEQLALLISHQCDMIQGYFFSWPLPPSEMQQFLRDDRRLPDKFLRNGRRHPLALFAGVEGFDEVLVALRGNGYLVWRVDDAQTAADWITDKVADVLVCGPPRNDFDALGVMRRAAEAQPLCERILLLDRYPRKGEKFAAIYDTELVNRVVHLPIDNCVFCKMVVDALRQKHFTDEFGRLSRQAGVAEGTVLRLESQIGELQVENQRLYQQRGLGVQMLHELVEKLPWPAICTDEAGLVVLINDPAERLFASQGAVPGSFLTDVFPELLTSDASARLSAGSKEFLCYRRRLELGEEARGYLWLMEGCDK